MECMGLAARNFAAMAASNTSNLASTGTRRLQLLCRTESRQFRLRRPSVLAMASAGSESCIAVREGFADDEDYIKGGGSELLFVQMQQNKTMEMQSKLADELPPISIGNGVLDLVVIGCGPAGLALAAESAALGLKVGLIGPDLPFTNNYGVWEDEFKDLGLEGCIEHVWPDTVIYLDDKDPVLIGRAYGRVSRHLLHEELLKKLATVASGAASGKLLQYEVGGPKVSVQTAYGVEVEEWSYIPVGGSLPNTEQKNLAFGAAASMVHPATGYSVVRSLSEAPKYASVIAKVLKQGQLKDGLASGRNYGNISMLAWNTLWPRERKRQRAFFLFGLALIVQLDIEGIRTFFRTFFQLPDWMWQGFLGSTLSSADLALFALYMFVIAPNDLRMCLVKHLLSDPTGATMIRTYLTLA
uniref:Lycopene cyclase n=1 Tax=Cucumis melo TaxID=3656 RepID=T1RR84_CUCME|nr:lycopene cyclase [Cucumis melo]